VSSNTRKCKNWIIDFGRWCLPRSEAPETFIFWTGLFALSSALRRRVFLSKKYLGSWEANPNLYILFIAPAGKARKSTTANYAEDLLGEIPTVTRSPELVTKEALLTTLVKSDDASMYVLAPEFGEFIVKSGPEMFGFLTNIYDGKKHISVKTLTRGAEFAERPCVNLLGATTPEWVAENMPESVIGGGFASRVVFIFEEKVRRRKMFYDDLNHDELDKLRTNLVTDLNHIALNVSGEFTLSKEAHEFFTEWYDRTADDGTGGNYKLHGYFERRPAHVIKVAMLVHLAYSDELIIEREDFMEAINLLKQVEHNLPQVFQSIGRNPYTVDIYRMLDYIVENGPVSKQEIRRKFLHAAAPSMLDELMESLLTTGYVSGEMRGDELMLKADQRLVVI